LVQFAPATKQKWREECRQFNRDNGIGLPVFHKDYKRNRVFRYRAGLIVFLSEIMLGPIVDLGYSVRDSEEARREVGGTE